MSHSMNQASPAAFVAFRIPMLCAAVLLLMATWFPVIEIKGFDTFNFSTVALWPSRIARFTLIAVILAVFLPSLQTARWLLALSVGILFSPLLDMVVRSVSLAEIMDAGESGDVKSLIVPLKGSWAAAGGLAFWLIDLLCLLSLRVLRRK